MCVFESAGRFEAEFPHDGGIYRQAAGSRVNQHEALYWRRLRLHANAQLH